MSKLQSPQVASHWSSPHLLNIAVLVVAGGLSGLYRLECRDKLLVGTQSPLSPNKLYVASVDIKHHEKEKGEKGPSFSVNMMVNVHRNHKAY